MIFAADDCREPLRETAVDHPVIIIAVHPTEPERGVSLTGDDKGADVVLGRVRRDLNAAFHGAIRFQGHFPYLINAVGRHLAVGRGGQ